MLLSVSPAATTWITDGATSLPRGAEAARWLEGAIACRGAEARAAPLAAWDWDQPAPVPGAPSSALAKWGSDFASIWVADALGAAGPEASLREADVFVEPVEPNKSPKRPESAQPATPNVISEMATSCGQMAVRGDTRMVTHSYATLRTSE